MVMCNLILCISMLNLLEQVVLQVPLSYMDLRIGIYNSFNSY